MRTHCPTPADTEALGERLARALPAARGAPTVVFLSGELGSGKTTLARGFLVAAGVTSAVRSPTYTLLELYPTPALTLVHLDLYRLSGAPELETLGLREWATAAHLWLIEWPERAAARLPAPDLSAVLSIGAAGHDIELSAGSALGESWLVRLERGPRGAG